MGYSSTLQLIFPTRRVAGCSPYLHGSFLQAQERCGSLVTLRGAILLYPNCLRLLEFWQGLGSSAGKEPIEVSNFTGNRAKYDEARDLQGMPTSEKAFRRSQSR